MSKLVYMGSGAIDPIAQSKRVFFRSTDSVTLSVGDAVCYKNDAVDYKERTVDPTHLGLTRDTYAEGEQEMTGRLFNVEEPLIDNIDQFAGIVKALGPKAGADGDMIEIWTGNSGAVVPVNLAGSITTVTGRTLLAVIVGQRTLGCPVTDTPLYGSTAGSTDSKIVGVAMEVRTTTGKCWVKLDENQFVHQGGNVGNELQVAAVADDVTVNRMNVEFKNTQDHCQLLHYRAKLSGTGTVHASRGVFRYEVFLNNTGGTAHIVGMDVLMDIGSGVTSEYLATLKLTLRTRSADPDLSSAGSGYVACCLFLEYIMTKTTTDPLTYPPRYGTLIFANTDTGGSTPDYLLYANGEEALAITDDTVEQDDQAAKSILIAVGGTEYHIPIYTDAEIA